jgi:branched-chain amino acid transport system ATP-binding protein
MIQQVLRKRHRGQQEDEKDEEDMSATILRTTGVTKSFGGLTAVNHIDLNLLKGDIHAIIGPNGAGKSTLFNLMTGYLKPDSGKVEYRGEEITGLPPFKISKKGLLRSFQVAAIFPMLSVLENVQVVLFSREGKTYRFFGIVKKMFVDEANEILKSVGLWEKRNVTGGVLSHGDRKSLELAIVIANKPEVVLLDEPTAGMSPEETRQAMDLIQRIRVERGLTILFTEHDMSVVFGIARQITVLYQGGVLTEGTSSEVRSNKAVKKIYLGEE